MRIVSLLPSATEILHAIGAGDRLVGVSHECDWPIAVRRLPQVTCTSLAVACASSDIDREITSMLADGQPLYQLDAQLLRRLSPDLIITQDQCDVCALPIDMLRACVESEPSLCNAKIVALNPSSFADVLTDIVRVGQAVGSPKLALQCTNRLRSRVGRVAQRTVLLKVEDRPRTIVIEWLDPLMISGNWMPELVELAGGINGLSTAGQLSRRHSWRGIHEFNPEVIVVAACGFDIERTRNEMPTLACLPGWCDVAAVRHDRVFVADGNAYFNRSGPRLVDSLELLAGILHPNLFAPPDDTAFRAWRA